MMITKNQTKIKTVLTFAFLAMATVGLTTASARAQTMSASLTAPVVDNADNANYGTVTGSDKWWAENNTGAGSAKGQTFTTGSEPIVLKSITYQVTSTQKAEPTKTYVVRVGTVSGTTFTEMHSETFTQDFFWAGGEYMTWTLDTSLLLSANTEYGIDVGMTSSTSGWQTGIPYINVTADEYPGGLRYSSGQFGVGDSEIHTVTNSDRIFHIDLRVQGPVYISPADEATLDVGNIDLLWENDEPTEPNDPVYVDVWFGTDPVSDFNKVVSADPNRTSYTADATTPGTYYWQVVNYVNGPGHINEPNELAGPVWSFDATTDLPPESVDAGVPMITWSGQPVSLDPNVVDDGKSALTYAWSADPAVGVSFDPSATVEAPTVTIDKSGIYVTTLVANPGFEIPALDDGAWDTATSVPDWSEGYYTGSGTAWSSWDGACGAIDPDAAYGYGGVAPEGENIAWCETDAGYDDGVSQTLPVALKAETQYDLSAKVGTPGGYPTPASWRIELLAGNVKIKEASGTAPDPNQWTTASLTHNSGSALTDPDIGQPLTIRLLATDDNGTDGVEVNFDDVQLTATPAYPLPALHTVTLTLGVSDEGNPTPVEGSMTIDVYDDTCQMARMGLGLSNISDFDNNCITDLRDYAIMAAKWLKDVSLTAPVLKP